MSGTCLEYRLRWWQPHSHISAHSIYSPLWSIHLSHLSGNFLVNVANQSLRLYIPTCGHHLASYYYWIVTGDKSWFYYYIPKKKRQWKWDISHRLKKFWTAPTAGKQMAMVFWDLEGSWWCSCSPIWQNEVSTAWQQSSVHKFMCTIPKDWVAVSIRKMAKVQWP
jgi:hypothetical protein